MGAWLYTIGGFMLPYISVGSICWILSSLMIVIVPSNVMKNKSNHFESKPLVTESSFETENSSHSEVETQKETDIK